jgi:hypothetical protein
MQWEVERKCLKHVDSLAGRESIWVSHRIRILKTTTEQSRRERMAVAGAESSVAKSDLEGFYNPKFVLHSNSIWKLLKD